MKTIMSIVFSLIFFSHSVISLGATAPICFEAVTALQDPALSNQSEEQSEQFLNDLIFFDEVTNGHEKSTNLLAETFLERFDDELDERNLPIAADQIDMSRLDQWIYRNKNLLDASPRLRKIIYKLQGKAIAKAQSMVRFKVVIPDKVMREFEKSCHGNMSIKNRVFKTLGLLQQDPAIHSLHSHLYKTLQGPEGQPVFTSYAWKGRWNGGDSYRILWYRQSDHSPEIHVLYIVPHHEYEHLSRGVHSIKTHYH